MLERLGAAMPTRKPDAERARRVVPEIVRRIKQDRDGFIAELRARHR